MKVQYYFVDNFTYSRVTCIEHDLGEGVPILVEDGSSKNVQARKKHRRKNSEKNK